MAAPRGVSHARPAAQATRQIKKDQGSVLETPGKPSANADEAIEYECCLPQCLSPLRHFSGHASTSATRLPSGVAANTCSMTQRPHSAPQSPCAYVCTES